VELVVQVNGKLRGKIKVSVGASREEIQQLAITEESIQNYVQSQPIKKFVVVPGRLVNIVI
jgi:leucyl-tRNA synthetase